MTDEKQNDSVLPITIVSETMENFLDTAGIDRVYGRPIKRDTVTIIPAAEVVTVMGFGSGGGGGTMDGGDGYGGGGGGGGRILSRPVAIVIASDEGVRVEPVMDVTKVALAALTAVGFMFSTMMKMRRGE